MFKKIWLITAGIIIANAIVNYVEATQLTTEFYPASNIPKEYQEFADGGDFTIINLEDWPSNNSISVFEKRLTAPKTEQHSSLKAETDETPKLVISSRGHIPGDPVIYTFKDSKTSKEITIVPNHLNVKSRRDGATVEARIASIHPVHYAIELNGFKKDEEILFKSHSYDEVIKRKITIQATQGIGFMPEVIGKDGGVARISVMRSSGEILNLEVPWGYEWMKYLVYYDDEGKVKTIFDQEEILKENPRIYNYFKSRLKNKNPISN